MKTWMDDLIDALEIDDTTMSMSDVVVLAVALMGWIAYAVIVMVLP